MKNVLIVAPDFYPNNTGFSNATKNLIEAVVDCDKSYSFFVYTPALLGNKEEYKFAKVFRTHYNKIIYYKKQYKEICKIIDDNNVDFILFETNTFVFLQDRVLKKYGNRVAVRIHSTADTEVMIYKNGLGGFKSKIVKKAATRFMNKCENIICTNSYHQGFIFREFYGNNVYIMWSKKHFILPNTTGIVGSESFLGDYIFTLGKLSYDGYLQKGISDFIAAMLILKNRGIFVRAIIVGDGNYRCSVEDMIGFFGLKDRIVLVPSMSHDEVIETAKKAKAVCLASRYEGQSMFATEALACGKPLILTTDNGMKDMINEGLNGYSVKTGDPNSIADKIQLLLSKDTHTLLEMGKNSRCLFDNMFSRQSIYNQFSYIFDTIVREK